VSQVPATAESKSKSTIAPDLLTLLPAVSPIIVVVSIVALGTAPVSDYREWLRRAHKLIEEEGLGRLEPLGRELAYARYARVTVKTDIENFYKRLVRFFSDATNALDEATRAWPPDKERALFMMASSLWRAFGLVYSRLNRITTILEEHLRRAKTPAFRKDPMIKIMPLEDVEDIVYQLEMLEEEQMELTNRKCIWIFKEAQGIRNYTFAGLINDVTACVHTLLDHARRVLDPELVEVYPGVLAKNPNPVLLNATIGWRETLTRLHELGVVDLVDYAPTRATVVGDKAELIVGSAPGHAVHIEISDGDIVAVYYDRDESVHEVLMKVAERIGVKVIAHEVREYTSFYVPADRWYLLFKCLLPFATTLDVRISYDISQHDRWRVLSVEDVSEIQRRYKYNLEMAEVHLILDAIKTLKLDRP
jgi:hypothetical protein